MADTDQVLDILAAVQTLLGRSANGITPPTEFSSQVQLCSQLLNNDVTGLINPIVDFITDAVGELKFRVETDNDNLTKKLNLWLEQLNLENNYYIPSGYKHFNKQYVKEYFKSSFNLVNYKFSLVDDLKLPTTVKLLDVSNLKYDDTKGYTIDSNPLPKNIFIRKEGYDYDEFPTPFLMARGVWANAQLKKALKTRNSDVLKQVLNYLLHVKIGDANNPARKPSDLNKVINGDTASGVSGLKDVLQDAKNSSADKPMPVYASNSDVKLEHVLADLTNQLSSNNYEQIDRDILSGIGMIDIVQGVSSSRKESVLNPKPLMQKTVNLILSIESIYRDLIYQIIEENAVTGGKYFSKLNKIRIVRSPIKAFWNDTMLTLIRSYYDRGLLSYRTTLDSLDMDIDSEINRRDHEIREGQDLTLYPRLTVNNEDKAIDLVNLETPSSDEEVTDDKKGVEAKNFNQASAEEDEMVEAFYKNISQIDPKIAKKMSREVLADFMQVFNRAWKTYEGRGKKIQEVLAFKTAWTVIKKVAIKNDKGIWIKKDKPVMASKEQSNEEVINDTIALKKLEMLSLQEKLIKKYLPEEGDN
jgi:cation transport regulator ChaB